MFARWAVVSVALCGTVGMAFAESGVAITSVAAHHRYPWNGKIDIVVEMSGDTNVIAGMECMFVATNAETQASARVLFIDQVGRDAYSENGCTRRYLWNAAADIGEVNVEDLALSVYPQRKLPGVQLWEDGPYWSECNVGAQGPEQPGYYFLWGDTVGYRLKSGSWRKDGHCECDTWESSTGEVLEESPFRTDGPCDTLGKSEEELVAAGCISSSGDLTPAYDAAATHLGAPWVMPRRIDMDNLDCCTRTWMASNGVYGVLFRGVGDYAFRSVFLPAAGWADGSVIESYGTVGVYWSSTAEDYPFGCFFHFTSERSDWGRQNRLRGQQVRAVRFGSLDRGESVTTHLKADCRVGLRTPSAAGDVLHYDAAWYENASEVRITDNGNVVANGVSGTWVWHWDEASPAIHILKLEALSESGEVVASESVRFGMAFRITGLTAQHRHPWNGKVDIVVEMEGDTNALALTECTFAATNRETAAAVAVATVGLSGKPTFRDNGCTRHYVWDAAADVGDAKIDDLALTVDVKMSGVQLWEGGPCWAERNLGAAAPEETGYYFNWGDVVGYRREGGTWNEKKSTCSGVTWVSSAGEVQTTSPFGSSACATYEASYATLREEGIIDGKSNLTAEHDAAAVHLGAPWHMPSGSECYKFATACTNTWTTRNGVYGQLVSGRGKYASRSIFFPASGQAGKEYVSGFGLNGECWSSTVVNPYGEVRCAATIGFDSEALCKSNSEAYRGWPIRPIRDALPLIADEDTMMRTRTALTVSLKVDCRAGVRALAAVGDVLRYDAAWYDNCDEVRITDNGVVVTNGVAGSCRWFPDLLQPEHVLKLQALSDGEVIGEETVRFSVGDGILVGSPVTLAYSPAADGEDVRIYCDGELVLSDTEAGTWRYEPLSVGQHRLRMVSGTNDWSVLVEVTDAHYATQILPDPQAVGVAVEPAELAADCGGGTNGVAVVAGETVAWLAWVTNQWLSVSPAEGVGPGNVTVRVAPYREVGIRRGSVIVGGKPVPVAQRGIDMKLAAGATNCTETAQPVVVGVAALGDVVWSVESHADWIEVVSAGTGRGDSTVELSVACNESYLPRTGTVSIGTETFSLTQDGLPSPIPDLGENATLEMITNVLDKAEDAALSAKITNSADYVAFRAWAEEVQPHGGGDPVGAAGVMAAPHAWFSYAFGCETLLEKAPTDADLTVEEFEPKGGEDGKFDFTVSVKDVVVGPDAAAENLKRVLELEGGSTLEAGGMSPANVDITFGTPVDGKVKFTAGPKDADAPAFFMKVKVKP